MSGREEWISHSFTMKHCLTVINHSWVPLIYEKVTLVPLGFTAFAWPIMLESTQELVKASREHLLRHWYWCFTQILIWSHGSEPQRQWGKADNNRKGALTSRERATEWPAGLPSLSACSYGGVNTLHWFSEYEPSLQPRKRHF